MPTKLKPDMWFAKRFRYRERRYIYLCKMEHYSAMREKEIFPFVTTWMKLESIMLSEIS